MRSGRVGPLQGSRKARKTAEWFESLGLPAADHQLVDRAFLAGTGCDVAA